MKETLLPILVSAVVSLALGWLGYRQATKAKRIETTASPYDALAKRVVELEKADEDKAKRIERLEQGRADDKRTIRTLMDDRGALIQYLTQLRDDITGGRPPRPVPAHLRDLVSWDWESAPQVRKE